MTPHTGDVARAYSANLDTVGMLAQPARAGSQPAIQQGQYPLGAADESPGLATHHHEDLWLMSLKTATEDPQIKTFRTVPMAGRQRTSNPKPIPLSIHIDEHRRLGGRVDYPAQPNGWLFSEVPDHPD